MNTSRRQCTNHSDNFCYICGKFTPKPKRRNIANRVKIGYKYYFGCKVGDQDKNWAPHICCTVCYASLIQWLNGKKKSMPFAVPMIWREPKNHTSDCYFCTTNIAGFSSKNKSKIIYPTCESALKPVEHDAGNGIPVPIPPSPGTIEMDSVDVAENAEQSTTNAQTGESSGSRRIDTQLYMETPIRRQLSSGDGPAAKRRKKDDETTTTLKEIFAEHREWEEKQMKEAMKQHQEIMMQSVAQLCTTFSAGIQAMSSSQTLPMPPTSASTQTDEIGP